MNDYTELRIDIEPCTEDLTDMLAAMLADCGYESFVPDDTGLTAYIRAEEFDMAKAREVVDNCPVKWDKIILTDKFIKGQDWNAEWEKNYFKPIVIGNRCVIHSSFHTDIPAAEYDIVIDPKMAFGTGHHQTTTLILERLLAMDLNELTFTDMGTGTGILAILAAMRGATTVNAIEIDPFAQVNAVENVALNGHSEINVILGDASALSGLPEADVFVANINRNIITADMASYSQAIKTGGRLIVSGFYTADAEIIEQSAAQYGLRTDNMTSLNDWCSIQFIKN
ncbi:MAG: 50S ribosomal protein L11 methyltransferase [Muribaculum sp.]|nr:50S ribosomal protein L11 methyltransferase [Muribaculum sp.]